MKSFHQLGQSIAIIGLERGISSRRDSSNRVDCVTTLCTHRPSLLPIANYNESFGESRRKSLESVQILSRRGRRSRNKVSVDESADGSLEKVEVVFFFVEKQKKKRNLFFK